MSCISLPLFKSLGLSYSDSTKLPLRTVGAEIVQSLGYVNINLVIADLCVSHRFVVLDISRSLAIIGDDFLKINEAMVDYGNMRLVLKKHFITPLLNKMQIADLEKENSSKVNKEVSNDSISSDNQNDVRMLSITKKDLLFFTQMVEQKGDSLIYTFKDEQSFDVCQELLECQQSQLNDLLNKYENRFAFNNAQLGSYTGYPIDIVTEDEVPVHRAPYRVSEKQREIIEQQIEEMLRNDVIEESRSPYASPIVIVEKPDGMVGRRAQCPLERYGRLVRTARDYPTRPPLPPGQIYDPYKQTIIFLGIDVGDPISYKLPAARCEVTDEMWTRPQTVCVDPLADTLAKL